MPLFRNAKTEPEAEVDPLELELRPSDTRGTEAMYGYVVALELTVTHGKGAPTHPATGLALGGLGASVLVLGIIARWKNRTVIALATIAAALVVDLPAVPDRLAVAKVFAVFIPLLYGIVLIRRRTKSTNIRRRAGLDPEGPRRTRDKAATSSSAKPVSTGRYTPPKAKRQEEAKKRRSRTR